MPLVHPVVGSIPWLLLLVLNLCFFGVREFAWSPLLVSIVLGDDLTEIEREEIDRAIALSLSEEDHKGKEVIEDDSQSEDDEQLCPLDDGEDDDDDDQQDEDEHVSKIQQDEDKDLDEVQLEEDEQLSRAIQESLSVGSPPRSYTDSIFQSFSNLFPPVYRICAGCNAEISHGKFLSCMGDAWHPECFCCQALKLPITDYENYQEKRRLNMLYLTLQEAALKGQETNVVTDYIIKVMSSDIAIAQLQNLERILLVHGHWCYRRISSMCCFSWQFYGSACNGFIGYFQCSIAGIRNWGLVGTTNRSYALVKLYIC